MKRLSPKTKDKKTVVRPAIQTELIEDYFLGAIQKKGFLMVGNIK